jgi:glycosyltransferase involved in cell wall biosynthesis
MDSKLYPLYSVIIPVYNGEKYLKDAILSVSNQTFRNFECIIVDDGSFNSSYVEEILDTLRDSRFKYISKNNGGVASALNLGIKESRGQYIAWLSHDDMWLPNKLDIQRQHLNANFIICTNYQVIDSSNRLLFKTDFRNEHEVRSGLDLIHRGLIHGCSTILPRNVFERVGEFNERLLYTQDYDYWLRAITLDVQFMFLDAVTLSARVHLEQTGRIADTRVENNRLWRQIVDLWEKKHLQQNVTNYKEKIKQVLEFKEWALRNSLVNTAEYLEQIELKLLNETRVSVIIPFQDYVSKLLQATNSVLAQTHQNIELLIVDDSHDGYGAEKVLESVLASEQLKKINFLVNKKMGVSSSRNLGLSKSTGDYIAFLDSDDVFLPNKIQIQLTNMIISDSKFSHTSYYSYDNAARKNTLHDTSVNSGKRIIDSVSNNSAIATPTVMILNDGNVQNLFNEDLKFGEDSDAWLTYLSRNGNSNTHIPESLTVVRTGINSAKHNTSELERIRIRNSTKHLQNLNYFEKIVFFSRSMIFELSRFLWILLGRSQTLKNARLINLLKRKFRGY